MSETLHCALCDRDVESGGHACFVDDGTRSRPEEHLAMCGMCLVFHEPHCTDDMTTKAHEETWFVEDDGPEVEVHRVGGAVCGLNGPHVRTPDDVKRARLIAQAPAMARLLLKIQFIDCEHCAVCPVCSGAAEAYGHKPDCELAAVLRAAGVIGG